MPRHCGLRVPNYFVVGVRQSANELAAVTRLSADPAATDVAVIFPEGHAQVMRNASGQWRKFVINRPSASRHRASSFDPVRPSGTLIA